MSLGTAAIFVKAISILIPVYLLNLLKRKRKAMQKDICPAKTRASHFDFIYNFCSVYIDCNLLLFLLPFLPTKKHLNLHGIIIVMYHQNPLHF